MNIVTMIVIGCIIIFLIVVVTIIVNSNRNRLLDFTSEKGMEETLTRLGNIAARAQKNVLDENEEILKESANKQADIKKDAVKTIVHAAKEGWTEDSSIYCKYCGEQIDPDSNFCKKCGKHL